MTKIHPTYHMATFGCQMNYSDSERVAAVLESLNFKSAPEKEADILIFNLCAVRQHAVDRIWGLLNKISKNNQKKRKNQQIILTGCILPADRNKFATKGITILDIKELSNWPRKIIELITDCPAKVANYNSSKNYFSIAPKYFSKFSAYVPIMTGCNNFCSYCAVPYTRGREFSRTVEEILSEVNKLIVQGYKEIILLGQNVNSYNSPIDPNKNNPELLQINYSESFGKNSYPFGKGGVMTINFPTLLKLIDTIPGNYWLSFLTSHPKDMTQELINCFNEGIHLVPYLHLPLQAGSNKILKAMNRHYSLGHYNNLIKNIRQNYVGDLPLNLSTDIIVGFPGEKIEDFHLTKKALEKIKFDMAYLSEYSPRAGTLAFKFEDNVSALEKEKRKNILNEVLKKTSLENNKKMLGLIVEVLVDQVKNGVAFGKTRNFKRIKIVAKKKEIDKKIIGSFVSAKITKANIWNLEGQIV